MYYCDRNVPKNEKIRSSNQETISLPLKPNEIKNTINSGLNKGKYSGAKTNQTKRTLI